jgi:hypothetical protein
MKTTQSITFAVKDLGVYSCVQLVVWDAASKLSAVKGIYFLGSNLSFMEGF